MADLKMEDRDYELWLLFARTHYRIKQQRIRELRKYGLSPEQAGVLFYINNSGNHAMPIELSRWMLREPQTITSIIDRMVKKGLVNKVHDSQRKNVVRLSLTSSGKLAYEQASIRDAFHQITGSLSEEKRQLFEEILTDLLKATKEFHKNTSEL